MNNEQHDLADLYHQNMLALKKYSFWKNDMAKRLAALIFAAEGQQVDIAAIRAAEAAVKRKTGLFSSFRGATDMAIYALLALTADLESYLDRILSAHQLLRKARFHSSDYLAVAACLIARAAHQENLAEQCIRAGNWLRAMKQQHRFLVGQDDYVYAVMLAAAGLDPMNDLDRIEQNYRDLRYDFRPRGSLYQLCQVLALSGKPDLCADRVRDLRNAFRAEGVKLDRANTLVSLGVLSYMEEQEPVIVERVQKICVYLRSLKGMGSFSVGRDELQLMSVTLVACASLKEQHDSLAAGVVSSAVTGIIMAQQAAIIAAAAGASAAASAASSAR
jgi:hypothetical protein